ncbi:MAG: permease [Flavobacteriaceae bacterium CG_4_10_14_3_um_filter_31_253]|nr:MAG: permease [Flavobacteriaceae bacterium CG2_30_31_66]PIY14921.1 MAG: permease [Flavobacteriaceae bacterium CG_4_10_14_3_um_filter_31_253]
MNQQQRKWVFLIILSLVWGSSYILIKKALLGFEPITLSALRITTSSILLLIVGFPSLKKIQKHHWKYIFYTAFLGTFFPVFLFSFAVQGIDSAIVSMLNSFTPFNTFIIGILVFGFSYKNKQFIGITLGLIGTLVLIFNGAAMNPDQNYWFALLPIIATFGYAMNVNIVKKHLSDLDALAIITGNFLMMLPSAIVVLYLSGFFSTFSGNELQMDSLLYVVILAIFGTGIAKVLYTKLVQISTPVYASSVTYLMPLVAIFWGSLDGEKLSVLQLFAGLIIMFGVYLVNRAK